MRLNPDWLCIGLLALGLQACASNEAPVYETEFSEASLEAVIDSSCPDDTGYVLPEQIGVTSTQISWMKDQAANPASYFAPLIPEAIYHLTSDDERFGGLSGVEFLDDDTLLLVSDQGTLFWLDVAPDTLEPADTGYAASLRDEKGDILKGKTLTDSEGLAWDGETLFISFERDHRVLAYDIEGCGAAARGMPVLSFSGNAFGLGETIHENRGIEALAVSGNSELILGLETLSNGAPVGIFGPDDRKGAFSLRLPAPEITMLTGLDFVPVDGGPDRLYAVFRSYDPIRGNRIAIGVSSLSENGELADMKLLSLMGTDMNIDNFEGIAVRPLTDTTDQIVIVSDDNFSGRQQTLLAVFTYEHQ